MGPPLGSEQIDAIAALVRRGGSDGFSGAVRVDVDGELFHESAHGFADRARRTLTWTVASNWTGGAWPIADGLGQILGTGGP